MSLHQPATSTVDGPTANDTTTRSVVLPVYAEPPDVWTRCVDELTKAGWDEVIVAIDDPDPATRDAAQLMHDRSGTRLSISESRRGKGGAIRDGLALANGDVIGFVDADGAVSPDELDRVYWAVEAGHGEVAVGSRNASEASRRGQAAHRRLLGTIYRQLASHVTGVDVSDFQCGAKAFRAEVWNDIEPSVTEDGFAIDTELLALSNRHGYEIAEVPIEWRDPGDSQVSVIRDVPAMFSSLLSLRRTLSNAGPVRLALVSDHPPNRGHLAEYGEELARAYAKRGDVEVTVLARQGADDEDHPYPVKSVWERDSTAGAWRLIRELRHGGYDAIHFNAHMTYFGETNRHRFLGLSLPALTRVLVDAPVVTTLHDMLEVIETEQVDEEVSRLERIGARVATQLVLLSDATTVTAAEYRDALEGRYVGNDVVHVPHGTFQRTDGGVPPIEPPLRLLQFGFLGPTKDIPTTIDAFRRIREHIPDAQLTIAGGSHPDYPGYQEALADRYACEPGIGFTGYIEDEDLDRIWHDASILLMPYRTATGVSGVFQLAKSYGVPVIAYESEGLRTSTVETGGTASFVPPGDSRALAARILDLWDDRDQLDAMARENAAAASQVPMAEVVDRMIGVFVEEADLDVTAAEVPVDG